MKKTVLKRGSKAHARALVAGSLVLTLALSPLTAFAAAPGGEVEAASELGDGVLLRDGAL